MKRLLIGLALFAMSAGLLRGQTVSEQLLLAAANQDRAEHGLTALRLDSGLTHAAHAHGLRMAEQRAISHQFAGEKGLSERVAGAGARFSRVTENVAEAGDAVTIHALWMQSAGHRANLLDAAVDAVGIAVVERNGQLYAVEDFAATVRSLSLREQERAVADAVERMGVAVTADEDRARATCAESTGFAGTRRPAFVMRFTTSDLRQLPEQLATRIRVGKYREAAVGACEGGKSSFASYKIAVILYP